MPKKYFTQKQKGKIKPSFLLDFQSNATGLYLFSAQTFIGNCKFFSSFGSASS
jgi:hypothetical protein